MRDALNEIADFITSRDRSDLDDNRMLVLALVKEIEIVGEAANALSPETLRLASDIPWVDVIGMRHLMVHAYDDINKDILWRTCTQDAPMLANAVERILSQIPDSALE